MASRSFTTENERTSRQLVRQIQALLTLLGSLSSEEESSDSGREPRDFEVYDDESYRYVSLKVPEASGHEIDINIHDSRLFARIEL